jgi:phosphoglycolate phosphatase
MKTAVAAGMFPVGAAWGFRSAEELRESGCKRLLNKPGALLDLLG